MKEIMSKDVAIGKVLGYRQSWNVLSHNAYVIVNIDNRKVVVDIDSRQLKFVQREYPEGNPIPLGFYNRKWHVGSKPTVDEQFKMESGVSFMDVVNNIKKAESC